MTKRRQRRRKEANERRQKERRRKFKENVSFANVNKMCAVTPQTL